MASMISAASYFYPRPPRGGRPISPGYGFLVRDNFYPRPPRGGRHVWAAQAIGALLISIHALREEGDLLFRSSSNSSCRFLSTPSARRATGSIFGFVAIVAISIHALREEGDVFVVDRPGGVPGISIHALREEGDHHANVSTVELHQFLSTPSARRATCLHPQW